MSKDNVTIKVKGVKEALQNIKRYQIVKREAIKLVMKRNAGKIETLAKQSCPVDMGRLRASISTNWAGSHMSEGRTESRAESGDGVHEPDGEKGMTHVVGTGVHYGIFQEHGTRKMAAQPFLYPAYYAIEGEIVRDIGKVLKKDIKLK